MRTTLVPAKHRYLRALAGGGAVLTIGIVGAPIADAAPPQCTSTGANTTMCSRPGGSTAITTTPSLTGPFNSCPYDMDYMCNYGVTWNIGGIFSRR
jgi:hypothetical protein